MQVACCIVREWLDSSIGLGKHKKWQQHGGGSAGRISYPSEPCTGISRLCGHIHTLSPSLSLFPCTLSLSSFVVLVMF